MARLILDTNILIGLERRGSRPGLEQKELPLGDFAIASITASELLAGVYRASRSDRRRLREAFVERAIGRWPVLPFDLPVARVHARLGAQLAAVGQRIGANDLIIAATALTHECEVLTHNVREFERVPGLTVRSIDW